MAGEIAKCLDERSEATCNCEVVQRVRVTIANVLSKLRSASVIREVQTDSAINDDT